MVKKILNFFGMSHLPFGKQIGCNELFESSDLREANARLEIAIENEDITLISGIPGCGKTTIIRNFINRLDLNSYQVVYVAGGRSVGEIAKDLLSGLQMSVPFHSTSAIRCLKKGVENIYSQKGKKSIFVIDEVDTLSVATLSNLKTLVNFNIDSENKALLILCGAQMIESTLNLVSLEPLNQRIRIRYSVKGLSLEEVSVYIDHHMKLCGVGKKIFTDEVKAEIYKASKGVLRVINSICYNLILAAVSKKKEIIESSLLGDVL